MIRKSILIALLSLSILTSGCTTSKSDYIQDSSIISLDESILIDKFEPVNVHLSDEEIKEETKYYLLRYADTQTIGKKKIEKENIVYITVTLYDKDKNSLDEYTDTEFDLCAGEYQFDPLIEDEIIGMKINDTIEMQSVKGTIFEDVSEAAFFDLVITGSEEYVYPKITRSFLEENFDVSTKDELYQKVRNEVEPLIYETKFNEITDEMIDILMGTCVFDEDFEMKADERYQRIMYQYEKYGKLYGLTIDEVLQGFDFDVDGVKEHARHAQMCWELAMYYVDNGEIGFTASELNDAKMKVVRSAGYETIEEWTEDDGELSLLEEVYEIEVKEYLYKKYIGEIAQYGN